MEGRIALVKSEMIYPSALRGECELAEINSAELSSPAQLSRFQTPLRRNSFFPVASENPSWMGLFNIALSHSVDPARRSVTAPSMKLSRTTRTCDNSTEEGGCPVSSVLEKAAIVKNDASSRNPEMARKIQFLRCIRHPCRFPRITPHCYCDVPLQPTVTSRSSFLCRRRRVSTQTTRVELEVIFEVAGKGAASNVRSPASTRRSASPAETLGLHRRAWENCAKGDQNSGNSRLKLLKIPRGATYEFVLPQNSSGIATIRGLSAG